MNAVFVADSAAKTMTSREIAELTGKELSNVHRDIRSMLDELKKDDSDLNHPQEDRDSRGYTVCFYLNRELTETLLTGYSAPARLKVIRRWHELEEQVAKPAFQLPDFTNPAVAARAWADVVEQKQMLALENAQKQALLAEAAPKVEFVDRYVESTGLKGFRQVAKLLRINEPELREFLTQNQIMYRLGGEWVAKQNHIDAGRFMVRTGTSEVSGHAYNASKFTPKGVTWLAGLIASEKALSALGQTASNDPSIEASHAK